MMLTTLHNFIFGTLRRRLIFSVAALQAVLMLLFIADLARRHRALLTQRQREQVGATVHTLAGASSGLVATNDLAGLQELVEAQRRTPGLRHAMFLDEDGHILAHTDRMRVGQYLRDLPPLAQKEQVLLNGTMLEGFAPIMIANHHLGWIYLSMDQREAQGRLAGITRDGVLYSLVAILVGSLLTWLLGSWVVRRLSVLQSAIHKVQEGQVAVRSTLTGTDEVAALSVGFNQMLDWLDQRDAELQQSEARYRTLVEHAPTCIHELDCQGRLTSMNRAGLAMLGVTDESAIRGLEYVSWAIPSDVSRLSQLLKEALNGKASEFEFTATNGHNFQSGFLPIKDARGAVLRLVGITQDITERLHLEKTSRFLAQAEWLTTGEDFFAALGRFLAQHLAMDYVCIDRLMGEGLAAKTLAIWFDGHAEDNVEYTLKDTPCGEVVGRTICCFPDGVRHQFPEDQVLQDMGAESYIGATLWGSGGQPIGLIALIGRHPITTPRLMEATLALVSVRASGELERRDAEAKLNESLAFTHELIGSMQDGFSVIDRKGVQLDVNPSFCRMTGFSREELVGVGAPYPYWPLEEQETIQAALLETIRGITTTFELTFLRKNGERFPVQVSPAAIKDSQGKTILFSATVKDITERKQAEAALRESEERWKFAIEGAGEGLWDWNLQSGKAFFSPRYKSMLGFAEEEIGDSSDEWSKRIHPEDAPGVFAALQPYIDGKPGAAEVEFRMQCKDGNWRWILGRGMVVQCDEDGKPLRMIGTNSDITERRQSEIEKAKLQTQLQQSQKMESLGTLAGGVAHDMNNVLGAILGLASAHIGTQAYGSPIHQALDTICKATERGGKMVKSLLSFARKTPVENTKLDMNAILREQVSLLERTTLAKVRFEIDLDADLRLILGDASALTHAFMNLCVNAIDAMPENGILTLHTRNVDNDWIEVEVEDNGKGMRKEVLEKAMEPFFTTKETGKGTGLGLSMVFSTVKAHRGQMAIESEPGQGTRVRLRFPACEQEGPGQAAAPAAAEARQAPHGSLKVLLVDDDDLIQSSVLAILECLGHTAVTTALSGEEALALLEAGLEPDLVILDMNMPGLGGTGTLPRLRRLRPAVPVLLSTGRTDQTALNLASAHLGVTLLAKPFGLRELQRHLESIGLG